MRLSIHGVGNRQINRRKPIRLLQSDRRLANIVGTMLAVSHCATETDESFSGMACLLILMKARRPKTGYAAAKPIWRKHRG
jgi:predicted acetyltransferase